MSVFGFVLRPCSYSIPIRIHAVLANELVYIPFPTHAIGSCLVLGPRERERVTGQGPRGGNTRDYGPAARLHNPLRPPARARPRGGGACC